MSLYSRTPFRAVDPQLLVALLLVILLAAFGCSSSAKTQAAQPRLAAAAVPVIVTTVTQRDVPLELHAIGNVQPYSTVQIKSQVSAQLEKAYFRQGEDVHKGQLLFSLDRRQLEADLKKAEGDLARDEAQLANARAKAARYNALLKEGVISKQEADEQNAQSGALEATVAADRATVENAKVQITYTQIYSPIEGRTGELLINEGNLIKANDTPSLVTINQIQPIFVDFSLPENQLMEVRRYMAGSKLKVAAIINGDNSPPPQGELTLIDNAVDPQTGTIKLRATFANHDRKLWPGQFVDAHLMLATQPNQIVVPSQAVQTGQNGQYVYVIKDDKTAEPRPVSVARTLAGISIISSGLKPGETVVTDGQVRLQPGAKVEIKGTQPGNANASALGSDRGPRHPGAPASFRSWGGLPLAG